MTAVRRWLVVVGVLAFVASLGSWLLEARQYAESNQAFRQLTAPMRAMPELTGNKWQDMARAFEDRVGRSFSHAFWFSFAFGVVGVANLLLAARMKQLQGVPRRPLPPGTQVVVIPKDHAQPAHAADPSGNGKA